MTKTWRIASVANPFPCSPWMGPGPGAEDTRSWHPISRSERGPSAAMEQGRLDIEEAVRLTGITAKDGSGA